MEKERMEKENKLRKGKNCTKGITRKPRRKGKKGGNGALKEDKGAEKVWYIQETFATNSEEGEVDTWTKGKKGEKRGGKNRWIRGRKRNREREEGEMGRVGRKGKKIRPDKIRVIRKGGGGRG